MTRTIKVGIFTSALDEVGGWGRYTVSLVRALEKQGVSCTVFTEDLIRPRNFNTEIFHLKSCPGAGLKNIFCIVWDWFRLFKVIRKFDIIHVCTETHIFLAWLLNKPYVVSTHGTYSLRFLERGLTKGLAVKAFNSAAAVIVTSEFTYEKIKPYINVRRSEQLPNGVDLNLFKRDLAIARKLHTIITVGGIKPRKGQDLVVRAVAELVKTFPDTRYLIVGEYGYFQNTLVDLIKDLHVEDSVIFAGTPNDEELIRLYAESGVFVLASRVDSSNSFEGYPLSLLEASACELPIIGSYGCGAEHLIKNGKNGFLIHQDNVDELVKYLIALFEDEKKSKDIGQNAFQVAKSLSWDKNAEKVIEIYKSICK